MGARESEYQLEGGGEGNSLVPGKVLKRRHFRQVPRVTSLPGSKEGEKDAAAGKGSSTKSGRHGCMCLYNLSCTSINLLPMLDFITFSIGHLENIVSLRYADLPSVDTFYYTLSKKITFVSISADLISKVFKHLGSCQVHGGGQLFQNLCFYLKANTVS